MSEEPLFKIKPVFVPVLWCMRFLPYHIGLSLLLAAIMIIGYFELKTSYMVRNTVELLPLYLSWLCMVSAMPIIVLKIREKIFFDEIILCFDDKIIFQYRKNAKLIISYNDIVKITTTVSRMQKRYTCGTLVLDRLNGKKLRIYDILNVEFVKKQIEECMNG